MRSSNRTNSFLLWWRETTRGTRVMLKFESTLGLIYLGVFLLPTGLRREERIPFVVVAGVIFTFVVVYIMVGIYRRKRGRPWQ